MDTSTPLASVPGVVPNAREGARRGTRPTPERSDEFSHLSLDDLRAYRRTLTTEEDQVSYWRRIIQARLDVVRAGTLGPADGEHLRPVLSHDRVTSSRTALISLVPADDIPPLPNLAELWDRRGAGSDEPGPKDPAHHPPGAPRPPSQSTA